MNDTKDMVSSPFDGNSSASSAMADSILSTYNAASYSEAMLIDQPQRLADAVYEAICKDIEEKPNTKGMTLFRDKVFENCSPKYVTLKNVRMGPNGVAALTRMMATMSIASLDLAQNNLGDEGVQTLANYIVSRPIVRHLNLASNGIGLEGVESIITLLPFLKTLNLSNVPGFPVRNQINSNTCGALIRALCANPGLHSLNLANNGIGIASSTPVSSSSAASNDNKAPITHTTLLDLIAVALSRYQTQLAHLVLDKNNLGTRGATTILAALAQNKQLRYLSLADNDITADVSQTLDVVLRVNTSLCGLILRNNPIGPGITRFCQALSQNKHLTVLDLENCGIDDAGALALAQVLAVNRSITYLNLAGNSIGSKGGYAIATALKYNQVLDSLSLERNPLRPEVGVALADALAMNESLTTLNLSSCKLDDRAVCALMAAISNNSTLALSTLRLRDNHISQSATGHAIASTLYKATTLTCLDVSDTQLDYARARLCQELCRRNKQALDDAVPQRLEREIELLRNEQLRLRRAEATLLVYHQNIEKTEALIRETERERSSFLSLQHTRREEIREQIKYELDLIAQASAKLAAKKAELSQVEKAYSQRLVELQLSLEKEGEHRKSLERELANVRRALEETIRQHPSKLEDLKRHVEAVTSEKNAFQKQLSYVKKELAKLKQAYEEGKPVAYLIDQAKALLAHQAVLEEAMRRDEAEADALGK